MTENSNDRIAPAERATVKETAKSDDSLFNRMHEQPNNSASETRQASGLDSKNSSSGKADASSDTSSVNSLYKRVVKEAKDDLLLAGEKLGFYPVKDRPSQTNSEARKMLEPLILTDDNKGINKIQDGNLRSAASGEAGASLKPLDDVKDAFKNISKNAYISNEAALAAVANRLADDPALTKMLTDQLGQITKGSINKAMRADLGQSVITAEHRAGSPRIAELNEEQRQSLDFVRTHIDGASAAAAAIETASGIKHVGSLASTIDAGISEKMLSGMSSNDLATAAESIGKAARAGGQRIWDIATQQIQHNIKAGGENSDGKTTQAETGNNNYKPKTSDSTNIETKGSELQKAPAADSTTEGNTAAWEKQSSSEKAATKEKVAEVRENTPQIADGEFSSVAKDVIEKIDTEHKGYVTKEQLARALEDPQFRGKEAQALAAMYQNFDKMHNLSKHEGWIDRKSINAGDLEKFDQIQKDQNERISEAYQMKHWAEENLSKYDNNGNNPLTKSQIEKFINDPNTPEEDKKALQLIDKHYSEMGHFWERGVTKEAIQNFSDTVWKDSADAKLVNGVWASTWNVQKGQGPEISHDLYGDSNNPLNSINPGAIRQGSIGDCYFESALAAVATSNPELIKNAIKDNGDGTYTVTFPGAKDEPITVKAPTEAEQGLYNHGSPNGLWASVMEKAYGEYCQKHFWRRGPFNLGGGNSPTEGADGGGRTSGSTKLLTGSDTSTNTTTFSSQASIAANLEKAFAGNPPKAVTAGINNGFSRQTSDQFYVGHAYSITGFQPDGKGGGMITIRNPWGGKDDTTDGTISIPLEKFMKNFSDITFQQ